MSFIGNTQEKSKLIIDFELLKYNEGKLFIAIYNNEESFLKKPVIGTVVEVNNGKATATFKNLKLGEYAVSSFYDKNDNGKLDTNFLGIPKEPTGVSNNPKPRMGPPRYKDAKFIFSSTNNRIKIKF
jgi:uncharacterized protein (DUF2141 family)